VASRVLLRDGTVLRRFLWLEQGRDGSVYLGASDPKAVAELGGAFHIPPRVGSKFVKYSDFEKLSTPLPAPKVSFHKGGKVHFKGSSGATRAIGRWDALREVDEPMRAALFLTPDVRLLPVFGRKVHAADIVLPIDSFGGKPFAGELLLAPLSYDLRPLILRYRGDVVAGVLSSRFLQAGVVLYHLPSFQAWSPYFVLLVPGQAQPMETAQS
jgi:hypothetical protein